MELIERYVHQVGRYLPAKDREDIQAELRSLIQDQLDDRYGGQPSQEEIAAVLRELGDPRKMAASYSKEQYLVGPDLYPTMMLVLRRGWLIIPSVIVILNVAGILLSEDNPTVFGLFLRAMFAALEQTFLFSAAVVGIFAILQHTGAQVGRPDPAFDPLELPSVDDPGSIDYFEVAFGLVLGTFFFLVLSYFLYVGGLTLRFSLSDPGDVIAVPQGWLLVALVMGSVQLLLHGWVLRRGGWTFGLQLVQMGLEIVASVSLYFILFDPLFQSAVESAPDLADTEALLRLPEALTLITVATVLLNEGPKLLRLWGYQRRPAPLTLPAEG